MNKCLFCYQQLINNEQDFHSTCAKKIFGQPDPPVLQYSEDDLASLAEKVIRSQITVTGVQAKISLHIEANSKNDKKSRFTIVGLWGGYILKPPSLSYTQLPEVEDLTMHLAQLAKIKTAPHSLIRLKSGNLAFITRRMDRSKKSKLAMEDMCQLTERLTENKYQGSYEQIAKTIIKFSITPGLDIVNFFELVLFSFLTGNADMHLKNFSLLEQQGLGMTLSPAYDLLNTSLVNPSDEEELALNLNGKKSKINRHDFIAAMSNLRLTAKQQQNIFGKMSKAMPIWKEFIVQSFLNAEFKEKYIDIINQRMKQIQ